MNIDKKSAAIAIAASGVLLATSAAPAVGSSHVRAATISTPQLTVKMSGKNSLNVTVPHRFTAGRVDVTLTAGKGEQAFEVLRLRNGYTFHEFSNDLTTYGQAAEQPTPAAIKALDRLAKHTVFCGGLDSGTGHKTVSGTVLLPTADTYYVINDSNGPNIQAPVVRLHVTARAGSRAAPSIDAVQKAVNAKRFRGRVNLPASGTLEFENVSTNSPHLFYLQHVKAGTTRKQVIKSFKTNGGSFFRPGSIGIDVVSPGHAATVDYALPAGDYAEVCFFPDLKTGMPHAFMGMVRIVHLS